jgi:hypothetical protein
MPKFLEQMTVKEFETQCTIQYMSPEMSEFLEVLPEHCPNQKAIGWLNSVCNPGKDTLFSFFFFLTISAAECIKVAATKKIAAGSVRKWTHSKIYEKGSSLYECAVEGFILPCQNIMFVAIQSSRALGSPVECKQERKRTKVSNVSLSNSILVDLPELLEPSTFFFGDFDSDDFDFGGPVLNQYGGPFDVSLNW